MAKLTREQIEKYLESQEAKDVMTIAAFTIDQTPTETDNEVVSGISEYADLLAEKFEFISESDPTGKEALDAAIRLAQKIASLTKTKWDDIIVGLAAKITGANKKTG